MTAHQGRQEQVRPPFWGLMQTFGTLSYLFVGVAYVFLLAVVADVVLTYYPYPDTPLLVAPSGAPVDAASVQVAMQTNPLVTVLAYAIAALTVAAAVWLCVMVPVRLVKYGSRLVHTLTRRGMPAETIGTVLAVKLVVCGMAIALMVVAVTIVPSRGAVSLMVAGGSAALLAACCALIQHGVAARHARRVDATILL